MVQPDDSASQMDRQIQIFASLRLAAPVPRLREDYPGITSVYDATYAIVPGFRPLALDLHTPTTGSDFPVLVWVHGGGWSGGSRAMGHAIELVKHGFAVAAVDYRLSGEIKYPGPLHDVKGAIRWLRANASKYRLDGRRIAGWGASAGAHLVSLAALTADRRELEGEVGGNLNESSALQSVVDYFGVTDFFLTADDRQRLARGNPVTNLLGYALEEAPEQARLAMPVTYARADAPPFLILHGDTDPIVPHAQSERLHAALTQAGATSTLLTIPGALHEDPAFWTDDILGTVSAFLHGAMPPAG